MAHHLPFSRTDIELTPRDIQFECEHCGNILIVDKDGEGMELACPHCGAAITVPPFKPATGTGEKKSQGELQLASAATGIDPPAEAEQPPPPSFDFSSLSDTEVAERLESVEHKLKENTSQRMELQGNMNRMTIDMHRMTLRLERVQRKQRDLEAEREALTKKKAAN